MKKSVLVLTVSAALAVAAFAATSNSQKSTVTVGDFAVKVTTALGQPVVSPTVAVKSLRTFGVKIDDANANLTEEAAAKILAELGLRVTTTNPNGTVTTGRADQLAAVVGMASSATAVKPSDTLPTECLDVKNRGTCQDCCKASFGCTDPNAPCDFASGCARFCKDVPPPGKASPSDPNP